MSFIINYLIDKRLLFITSHHDHHRQSSQINNLKPFSFNFHEEFFIFLFQINFTNFHASLFSREKFHCSARQAADVAGLCVAIIDVRAMITCPITSTSVSRRRKIILTGEDKKMKNIIEFLASHSIMLTRVRYERQLSALTCSMCCPSWTDLPTSCPAFGQHPTTMSFVSSFWFQSSSSRTDRREDENPTPPVRNTQSVKHQNQISIAQLTIK